MLDVNSGAQPPDIFRDIVTEHDAPHRRLAGPTLAHQQHLALLLPLGRVHRVCRANVLSWARQASLDASDNLRSGGGAGDGKPTAIFDEDGREFEDDEDRHKEDVSTADLIEAFY